MKPMHTLKTAIGIAFLAGSQLLASQAGASVVDFEDVAAWSELTQAGFTSRGFRLSSDGNGLAFAIGPGETMLTGNGSTRLLSFNGAGISIAAPDKRAFDLLGFDGGESWFGTHFWATRITAVGRFAGGGTTTQVFDLDLFKDPVRGMQRFIPDASFRNLQSVSFTGIGGNPEFSLDNISVTAVPEPVSGALLLLGAAGLAVARRRNRK